VTRYVSTRGAADPVDFRAALLAGLAPDGGLYVPQVWPELTTEDLAGLRGEPYTQVVARTMAPFTTGFLTGDDLSELAEDAYGTFGHPDVAPITDLGGGLFLLELFWGPTLAFKDMAMQMLSRMVDRGLSDAGTRATVLGATSGDTGSAAIEAFRDRDNIDVVILYPQGRVSEVQRRQMTTVDAANVHAIAIEGTFDDCQDIVKALFADEDARAVYGLTTANSINWGRIVAQIPYYVWAATLIGSAGDSVSFGVPSGNFGNVFSGYAAAQIGVPVRRFAVGSNANHVLTTFLREGRLELGTVVPTLAPSMDIQIPSNLERLIFDLLDRDGAAVARAMSALRRDGSVGIDRGGLGAIAQRFTSTWIGDDEVQAVMADVFRTYDMMVDPHTAIGIHAARTADDRPMIALATAHPAKFPETVVAATGRRPDLPLHLSDLHDRAERVTILPADPSRVRSYLDRRVTPAG